MVTGRGSEWLLRARPSGGREQPPPRSRPRVLGSARGRGALRNRPRTALSPRPQACRLQKLFGADGDLADEDFLSAVEDAENQFVVPRHLSPVSPPVQSPAPGLQPLRPLGPQLSHHPSKAPSLRPLTGQREQPTGCWGPPTKGAAPQDELDNDLFLAACMELEGPELPAGAGAARPPPAQWEKPPRTHTGQQSPQEWAVPKKLQVGEELDSSSSGGAEDRQDPLPTPQAAPTPKLVLRPSTAGACPPRPPTLPQGKPCGSRGSIPTSRGPSPRPFQASPCQPVASSSLGLQMPRTPMAQAPRQSCPQPRLPPNPPTLMTCVEPPLRQPPRPAPGNLQTPVVTNHLVQLVTAASKAPGGVPRLPPQGKTRRFPGPAGILPQQHSGKLLDEILVSAPQTPAHGALAKPRAEGLPSSSPPTEEDFGKGPWLAMKTELELDERDPSCFLRTYSVVMVLRKAALKQLPKNKVPSMAVMIKTLTRTNVDAGAVFRDPTGEMQGTVHRLLLEERHSELRPGSVLLLKQVGVFSPSHRNHYLNVTPNNLLKIYPPEPEGSFSQQEVPAQAGLVPDHPTQPPWDAPAAGDWGQSRRGGYGTEQASGGFSLHSQSPGPGQEELMGADGCDMDDLDGLLGELPEDFFSAPAQADCC
ncbi:homologous recombination OB-fold protein [Dryobates pubescens]|uniref:homologous recombination OB-fold protein n=1 Tax=Dryobates pubescens TaxID=118200 RepID=UPI0023B9D50C|nr:homologous recombination OB-fold protein [Dryobates pubescens]